VTQELQALLELTIAEEDEDEVSPEEEESDSLSALLEDPLLQAEITSAREEAKSAKEFFFKDIANLFSFSKFTLFKIKAEQKF